MTEYGYISLGTEEINFASLCVDYLNILAPRESVEEIDSQIRQGYYVFIEYAVPNWVWHLEAGLARAEGDNASESISGLAESLEAFLDLHWANPTKVADVAARHEKKLEPFRSYSFYPRLRQAFVYTRRLMRSHCRAADSEIALDLVEVLMKVRERIESIWEHSENVDGARKALEEMYGKCPFKCPRFNCQHFSNGFETRAHRDEHLRKHERPYRCTVEGCSSAITGFSTSKGLGKHMDSTHGTYVGDEAGELYPTENEHIIQPPTVAPAVEEAANGQSVPADDTEERYPAENERIVQPPEIAPVVEKEDDRQSVQPGEDSIESGVEGTTEPGSRERSPATPDIEQPAERPKKKANIASVFQCPLCSKRFTKKWNLDSHTRTHSPSRPYRCAYCTACFARASDCGRHEASHAEPKYRCEGCGKAFARGDTLRNHLRSRAGSRCSGLGSGQATAQSSDRARRGMGMSARSSGTILASNMSPGQAADGQRVARSGVFERP